MKLPILALLFTILHSTATAITPSALRCENRINPLGIDVQRPRLSWILDSGRQTGYQIEVPGVWDSGKIASEQSIDVEYSGPQLKPQTRYTWRVRAWDNNGQPGDWSKPASFVTGILGEAWQGKWIVDGQTPEHPARGLGYHAAETTSDELKWVQVDLGRAQHVDSVVMESLRHQNLDGFGFPVRYKVEGADEPTFKSRISIADHTDRDAQNPGCNSVTHTTSITARYIRVTATHLYPWNGKYCFALSELGVFSKGHNVATNQPVTYKDTVDDFGWHHEALTDGTSGTQQCLPVFQKKLSLQKRPREAVLSICGLGQYELFLNRQKVGDELLSPGWSNYRKVCLYDTFDLTDLLIDGENEFRVMLGNGFFNVKGGRYTKLTGSFGQPMLTFQFRLRFEDGSEHLVISDESWKAAAGPITFSCIYGGEDYDARRESLLSAPDSWTPAKESEGPGGTMVGLSQAAEPIGPIESLEAIGITKVSPNVTIYDFGQNVSFMPKLTVKGPSGASVKMVPSEWLGPDGRISDPMCGGNSYYHYTLKGAPEDETWSPQFFYRGGRFLQVETSAPEGKPLPEIKSIKSIVVHSKAKPAGDFSCSNDLFNRIRTLIRWAQRSNMMSVLTDCPQREKLGWLEQYHLHGDALRYEWDMSSMYTKGMGDMAQAQLPSGLVPDIAPEYTVFEDGFRDSPEWGASFVIVPWQQYECTGDRSLLTNYFDGMKRYCDYLQSKSQGLIVSHGLGDWFDIGPKPPGFAQLTPKELTATAYFYKCAEIIAHTAMLIGKDEDAQRYGKLAQQIREAFNRKF